MAASDMVWQQLPSHPAALQAMPRQRLLNYLMLAPSPAVMDWYLGVAERMIMHDHQQVMGMTTKMLQRSKKDTDTVERKLFWILVALNCSGSFLAWVQQGSTHEIASVNRFVRRLAALFRQLVEQTDSEGKAASQARLVQFPYLLPFVDTARKLYLNMESRWVPGVPLHEQMGCRLEVRNIKNGGN